MDLTKEFLRGVLEHSNLEERYISVLTDGIEMYQYAFTSPSVDAVNNYELYELLGDATANEALVWYFYDIFPQLQCASAVKTIARLKIKYSSSESYSSIAEELGFWPYVKASEEELASREKKQKLLEDVFEAFIGVTKSLLQKKYGFVGVGNQIVYNMIRSFFKNKDIPLNEEELHDAKTRLKEIFDKQSIQEEFGRLHYVTKEGNNENERYTVLYFVHRNVFKEIAKGYGVTKVAQEKNAAAQALEFLKRRGVDVTKKIKLFCERK